MTHQRWRDGFFRLIGGLTVLSFSVFGSIVNASTDCPVWLGIGINDITIKNLSPSDFTPGEVINCLASSSITVGDDVAVPANVAFNLISPRISFTKKVSMVGRLRVITDTGELNDTGIVEYGDDSNNNLPNSPVTYPGQDARYGRDSIWNDDGDGHAGFSFTKLDAQGNVLAASATDWSCVKDNVTGFIWEVKDDVFNSLRNKDNTYSWYNPDTDSNGGSSGVANDGLCSGSDCDTQAFVEAVNAQALCGADDWRLPSFSELVGILSLDRYVTAIDSNYFPNTIPDRYWTSTPSAVGSPWAEYVEFADGRVDAILKSSDYRVRLVREAD